MQKALSQLIDVIALSQKECERPILANLAYASRDNFLGQIVEGYTAGVADFTLMTRDAAAALCQVQDELTQNFQLGLLILDAYRPKRAVHHFVRWASEPVPSGEPGQHELKRKDIHYPHIEKNQLFDLGYVAYDSQHCYGHTVDLVLIDREGNEIDLGACFDYMDELSHVTVTAEEIGIDAHRARHILSEAMRKFGFVPYPKEFWHFSFAEKAISEPIDIVITPNLRSLNVV